MPKKLKPQERVHGYTVIEELSVGAMAIAYAATDGSGQKVFLKQYMSPSSGTAWYRGYVDYQKELKRRVESSTLKGYCYRMIEFFVENHNSPTYFQVFEFGEKGTDLEGYLETMKCGQGPLTWNQRAMLAGSIMGCIAALHDHQIVHSDLKPKNIHLLEDKQVSAGFDLKLIGLDFSILSDIRAPWHGEQGYVGSPNYFSPEHLTGAVPLPASDVFTCGLMLYELLGEGHPYKSEEEDSYRDMALAFAAQPPKLDGDIADGKFTQAAETIHACLNPDPAKRPTAPDVASILKKGN